jgi:hypothetical protein
LRAEGFFIIAIWHLEIGEAWSGLRPLQTSTKAATDN